MEKSPPSLRSRMFVDRFATDSYQNILFSLIQFPLFAREMLHGSNNSYPDEIVLSFPNKLTVVSHEFKRSRFLDLHLPAARWARTTEYIGINPPFDATRMAEIETGDLLRGYGAWRNDVYGVGELLAKKRKARGWDEEDFRRGVLERLPAGDTRSEIEGLLLWSDEKDLTKFYEGKVPW